MGVTPFSEAMVAIVALHWLDKAAWWY